MNMPPNIALRNPNAAMLRQPSGAPSADQLKQSLAQTQSRVGAMQSPEQAQMLGGIRETMKEAEMEPATAGNIANQFLLSKVANLKGMAGVTDGSRMVKEQFGDQGIDQILASIGMTA